jgi:hypothetical protein
MRFFLFFILLLSLAGTASPEGRAQNAAPHSPVFPLVEDALRAAPGPAPETAKIFLVAGSSLAANFAQEIIDQKKLWTEKGIPASEIACYFVLPTQEEFEEELTQYLALAEPLKNCFPASVKQLQEDLKRVARKNPPYLYLYLTSHGRQPISEKLKALKRQDPNFGQLRYLARYRVLDQYSLDVEGLPDGPAGPYELLGAYRGGMNPQEVFLTPRYLFEFLQKEFPKTAKYLVLQGCYSGGFLVDPRKEQWDALLTNLKNVTVLTSARHNRESFGCDPGDNATYYGKAFNEILQQLGRTPPETDWRAFQTSLKAAITQMEKKMGAEPPSDPAYFSNQGGTEEFL